jgi:hypothetical protein
MLRTSQNPDKGGGSEHIPKMGDIFLLQMEDFFAEGVCFDTSKEGEGGAPTPRSPILRMSAWAIRAAAAGNHLQTFDFLSHGFVEDGVG